MIKILVSTQNIKNDFGYFVNLDDEEIIKKSSLYKAIENEDNNIALLLLSNETIDVNQINKYMIHWSQSERVKEEKKEERDKGYGSHSYKWYDDQAIGDCGSFLGNERVEITDLCLAIEKNENEVVEQLLNHITIDINIPYKLQRDWKFGYEGDTEPCKFKEIIKHSLYIAIENNNFEIVKLLTSHESLDINFKNIIKNVKIKSDSYRGDQTSFKRYYELIIHFLMDFEGAFFDTTDYEPTNKMLGKGSFGKVFVVNNTKDGKQYAAKLLNPDNMLKSKDQMMLLREVQILCKLDHPSIVKFYGINFHSFLNPTQLEPTILTEYLKNGSLKKVLDKEKNSIKTSCL